MADVFTLEAVFAKEGDALILHYGPWDKPDWILIDGGPRGVYRDFLRPRLDQMREEFELEQDEAIRFKVVMVSHVDADHVVGIIDLFEDLETARANNVHPPFIVDTLWHNSFDDILGNQEDEIVSRMAAAAVSSKDPKGLPLPKMRLESRAVVQSTGQGRNLRNLAKKLNVDVNKQFEGLIMAPAEKQVVFDHDLRFTVIGPSKTRVNKFQEKWDKDLKKILKKESDAAEALAFTDRSPFNLASICVLAEMQGKKMLLTGDARGDFILEGLRDAKLLKDPKPLHVDIMKVPHHGSDRNVDDEFFELITADHYVISGDGKHDNPELKTLEMVQEARAGDEYTVHFTFTQDAHEKETRAKPKEALKKVAGWVAQKPACCTVVFQDDDEEVYSVCVDLLDPLYEG